ncbi:MAG: hypothetical protein HY769_04610 [Candidatus Stahlbacteria bacterium]|nr:hypothetical protein [Candidatus Stahlbacteria bacterium]
MGVSIELSVKQLATAVRQLSETDVKKLDAILRKYEEQEILKRSEEAKRGKIISVKEAACFNDLK